GHRPTLDDKCLLRLLHILLCDFIPLFLHAHDTPGALERVPITLRASDGRFRFFTRFIGSLLFVFLSVNKHVSIALAASSQMQGPCCRAAEQTRSYAGPSECQSGD